MVEVPVSLGELLDKLTIVRIKEQRIPDPSKLRNIGFERSLLTLRLDQLNIPEELHSIIQSLTDSLHAVNLTIWDVEDEIRKCEAQKDFGGRFIELARSVYYNNDERSRIKREINNVLGSKIIEEKSYAEYREIGTEPQNARIS